MIKPGEIQKYATKSKVKDGQIEKDYVLSWILYGISQNKFLSENLIFKGGTVLKKVYFEDYRFSEDLDFTLKDNNISNEQIFQAFNSLIAFVKDEANIQLARNPETEFDSGNVNFYISYGGPLGGAFGKKDLKIDITRNEILCFDVVPHDIYRSYSDLDSRFQVKCYSKQEVLAEKMRSLMERTQPRDIYDLWYLLEIDGLNISEIRNEFRKKVEHKGLNPDDFISKVTEKESKYKSMWEKYLSNQIHDLPEFDCVFRDLMKHLRQL
jgi:uncharacterized protein